MPYLYQPEPQEETWGDYIDALQAGAYGIGANYAAQARQTAKDTGNPLASVKAREWQNWFNDKRDANTGEMTPKGRELLQSTVGSPAFWESPIAAVALQTTNTLPSAAVSLAPLALLGAGPLGVGAGAALAGAQSSGSIVNDIQQRVDNQDDEWLQENIPQYANDRLNGVDEREARDKLIKLALGNKPFYAFMVGTATSALAGPVAAVARGVGAKAAGAAAERGALATAGRETVLGALGEGVQGATEEAFTQGAAIAGGFQDEYDIGRVAEAGAGEALVGGVMSGVAGGVSAIGAKPAKPSTAPPDPDIEQKTLPHSTAGKAGALPIPPTKPPPPVAPTSAIPVPGQLALPPPSHFTNLTNALQPSPEVEVALQSKTSAIPQIAGPPPRLQIEGPPAKEIRGPESVLPEERPGFTPPPAPEAPPIIPPAPPRGPTNLPGPRKTILTMGKEELEPYAEAIDATTGERAVKQDPGKIREVPASIFDTKRGAVRYRKAVREAAKERERIATERAAEHEAITTGQEYVAPERVLTGNISIADKHKKEVRDPAEAKKLFDEYVNEQVNLYAKEGDAKDVVKHTVARAKAIMAEVKERDIKTTRVDAHTKDHMAWLADVKDLADEGNNASYNHVMEFLAREYVAKKENDFSEIRTSRKEQGSMKKAGGGAQGKEDAARQEELTGELGAERERAYDTETPRSEEEALKEEEITLTEEEREEEGEGDEDSSDPGFGTAPTPAKGGETTARRGGGKELHEGAIHGARYLEPALPEEVRKKILKTRKPEKIQKILQKAKEKEGRRGQETPKVSRKLEGEEFAKAKRIIEKGKVKLRNVKLKHPPEKKVEKIKLEDGREITITKELPEPKVKAGEAQKTTLEQQQRSYMGDWVERARARFVRKLGGDVGDTIRVKRTDYEILSIDMPSTPKTGPTVKLRNKQTGRKSTLTTEIKNETLPEPPKPEMKAKVANVVAKTKKKPSAVAKVEKKEPEPQKKSKVIKDFKDLGEALAAKARLDSKAEPVKASPNQSIMYVRQRGARAFAAGKKRSDNPYEIDVPIYPTPTVKQLMELGLKAGPGQNLDALVEEARAELRVRQDRIITLNKKLAKAWYQGYDAAERAAPRVDLEATEFSRVEKPLPIAYPKAEVLKQRTVQQRRITARTKIDKTATDAQRAAGNARGGLLNIYGLEAMLQYAKGMMRHGNKLLADYGHFKRTIGADKQPVDVFFGPNLKSDTIYVIEQLDENGEFDEHKVMAGFDSAEDARLVHRSQMGPSWRMDVDRSGDITPMSIPEFQKWIYKDHSRKEVARETLRATGEIKSGPPVTVRTGRSKRGIFEVIEPKGGVTGERLGGTRSGYYRKDPRNIIDDKTHNILSHDEVEHFAGWGYSMEEIQDINQMPREHIEALLETTGGFEGRSPVPDTAEEYRSMIVDKFKAVPHSFEELRARALSGYEAGTDEYNAAQALLDDLAPYVNDVPAYYLTAEQMGELTGTSKGASKVPLGQYRSDADLIVFWDKMESDYSPQETAEHIIHEFAHPAFGKIISTDKAIRDAISRVAMEFREHLPRQNVYGEPVSGNPYGSAYTANKYYAFMNEHEFVSEFYGNPSMRRALSEAKASPGLKQFLRVNGIKRPIRSLLDAIKKIFAKALGMKVSKANDTLLDAMFDITRDMQRTMGGRADTTTRTMTDADYAIQQRLRRDALRTGAANPWLEEGFGAGREFPIQAGAIRDFSKAAVENVVERFQPSPIKQTRVLGLKLLGMDQIAQKAKDFGSVFAAAARQVANAFERMRVRSLEIEAAHNDYQNKWVALRSKYRGTDKLEQLGEFMIAETEARMRADIPLNQQPHLGPDLISTAWPRGRHAALKAMWDALPADLQAIRTATLDLTARTQKEMAIGILQNQLLATLGVDNRTLAKKLHAKNDLTPEELQLLSKGASGVNLTLSQAKELEMAIRTTRALTSYKGPYYPEMRFGNFVVTGTYKFAEPASAKRVTDPDGAGSDHMFEFIGPNAQAEAMAYAATQGSYSSVRSSYVDEFGNTHYVDLNDDLLKKVSKEDATEQRFRVNVSNKFVEFFDSQKEAATRAVELQQDSDFTLSHLGARAFDPNEDGGREFLSHDIRKLISGLEKHPAYQDAPTDHKAALKQSLVEISLRFYGPTRVQSMRMARRHVKGASIDFPKVMNQYIQSTSGYLAKLEVQPDLNLGLDNMKAAINSNEGDGITGVKAYDARQQIHDEMLKRVTDKEKQGPPSNWDIAMNRVMGWTFINFLASPSYSINQTLQVPMVAGPHLAARHGLGRTGRALTNAARQINLLKSVKAGAMGTIEAARGGKPNFFNDILTRVPNPKHKEMLRYLQLNGTIAPEAGLEFDKVIGDGFFGRMTDVAQQMARAMPASMETMNRIYLGIAAYDLEIVKNGGDHQAAMEYAQEAINLTQGNYSRTNMPTFFHKNPLMAIAFQFKNYGQTMYANIGHNIGKIIRNANPGDRAEATKALTYLAASHVLFAGVLGLPTEPIRWLLIGTNAVGATNMQWDEVENAARELAAHLFGNYAGEIISRGLPRAIGVDISGRVGSQNLMTFGMPRDDSEESINAYFGAMVAGASGGMAREFYTGMQEMRSGNIAAGIQKFAPVKIMSDSINAYRLATEGKKTAAGYEVLAPISYTEAFLVAFGYKPARHAEVSEAQQYFYAAQRRVSEERNELQRQWAQATGSERARIMQNIRKFNRGRVRDEQLTSADLNNYKKRQKADARSVVGGVRETRRNRQLVESLELYNR